MLVSYLFSLMALVLASAPAIAGFERVRVGSRPGAEPVAADAGRADGATKAAGSGGLFDTALLALLAAERPSGNIAVSPLSLRQTAYLLLAGAEGAAQKEILKALAASPAETPEQLLATAKTQYQALASANAELLMANGIWVAPDMALKPAFVARAKGELRAEVSNVDFAQPQAAGIINDWFKTATRGLIPQLLNTLPPDTRVVLGNALYFKGRWQQPFDSSLTKAGVFHTPAGDMQRLFMHRDDDAMAYRETGQGQGLRMPFSGTDYEALVLLPNAGNTPEALLDKDGRGLAEWLDPAGYRPTALRLALPKAELAVSAELLDPLRKLGLPTALGPQADYGALSDSPLQIGRVVQKVVLKMDEAGAEAAAATAVVAVRSAAIQPKRKVLSVDRPYVVALRHVGSGALVALAVVRDPAE